MMLGTTGYDKISSIFHIGTFNDLYLVLYLYFIFYIVFLLYDVWGGRVKLSKEIYCLFPCNSSDLIMK